MGLGGGGGGMGGMGGGKWGRGGGDDRDMSRDGVLMYREAPMPPAYVNRLFDGIIMNRLVDVKERGPNAARVRHVK